MNLYKDKILSSGVVTALTTLFLLSANLATAASLSLVTPPKDPCKPAGHVPKNPTSCPKTGGGMVMIPCDACMADKVTVRIEGAPYHTSVHACPAGQVGAITIDWCKEWEDKKPCVLDTTSVCFAGAKFECTSTPPNYRVLAGTPIDGFSAKVYGPLASTWVRSVKCGEINSCAGHVLPKPPAGGSLCGDGWSASTANQEQCEQMAGSSSGLGLVQWRNTPPPGVCCVKDAPGGPLSIMDSSTSSPSYGEPTAIVNPGSY